MESTRGVLVNHLKNLNRAFDSHMPTISDFLYFANFFGNYKVARTFTISSPLFQGILEAVMRFACL